MIREFGIITYNTTFKITRLNQHSVRNSVQHANGLIIKARERNWESEGDARSSIIAEMIPLIDLSLDYIQLREKSVSLKAYQ